MTAPRITFIPLYAGADLSDAKLGQLIIGRVSSRSDKGAWICWLPSSGGASFNQWREEKTLLAAKNALIAKVTDWLRLAGVLE